MDEVIALSMIFSLIMVTLIGGFILMFPITRRLGAYLERRIEEGTGGKVDREALEQIHRALHELRGQVEELRNRQEFVERLVEGRSQESLGTGDPTREGEDTR